MIRISYEDPHESYSKDCETFVDAFNELNNMHLLHSAIIRSILYKLQNQEKVIVKLSDDGFNMGITIEFIGDQVTE